MDPPTLAAALLQTIVSGKRRAVYAAWRRLALKGKESAADKECGCDTPASTPPFSRVGGEVALSMNVVFLANITYPIFSTHW